VRIVAMKVPLSCFCAVGMTPVGREDFRTIGLIGFAVAAALGIAILVEGIRYTNPDVGDPLSGVITLVGSAVALLGISGVATVLLAFRSDRE
jgi:hypothetical protein